MEPDTTDPWDEWRATWRPVRRPGAREDDTDLLAFTFDPHRPEHAEAIRALGGKWCEHLWTLKDAGGMALAISAGHSIVDRMGYLLTERAHEGFEATPVLMLGDPDICVVPDEMTDHRGSRGDRLPHVTRVGARVFPVHRFGPLCEFLWRKTASHTPCRRSATW